jgi:hypothetical protein
MSLWRVRIALSDDRRSQELLAQAVAGKRVCSSLVSPRGTETTVDMIIELADVSGLGDLLGELHAISSQVLVSSAERSSSLPAIPRQRRARRRSLRQPRFAVNPSPVD